MLAFRLLLATSVPATAFIAPPVSIYNAVIGGAVPRSDDICTRKVYVYFRFTHTRVICTLIYREREGEKERLSHDEDAANIRAPVAVRFARYKLLLEIY